MALKIGYLMCVKLTLQLQEFWWSFSNPLQTIQMIKSPTLLQSHKTDLLLINEITRPSQIANLQAPANMTQLNNLLKFKNTKDSHSRQEKQNAQAWLNKEGIDISPLIERVRKAREITMQKQELRKIEEDCIFYIPNMSYKKIEEYESKANDYGTMTLIQHNMRKHKFSHKVINRCNAKMSRALKIAQPESIDQFPMRLHSSINTQPRSEEKRQNYLKCISLWEKNNAKSGDELAGLFSQKINKKFWNIMANHIKCINQATDILEDKRIAQLYMESLRMVEDEYKTGMPQPTSEALNFHLEQQFFGRLEKGQLQQIKYIKDSSFGAFWGKAFVLYRAGRKGEFYNLLALRSETQLLQAFREVDQSIQRRQPITKDLTLRVEDIFYEQLMFALRGQSKYSSKVVANLESLDTVWVILRNLGIFYERKKEEVDKSRKDLLEYYNNRSALDTDQLYNYFYLLAYDKIASMGLSDIMDQDDFVHFMICLNSTPQLLRTNHQKQKAILNSQLILYIKQLISLNRPQYLYYMLFIPEEYRAAQISTILSSSNLVSTFDWSFLKAKIPSQAEFELIATKTLEKYILTTNDYISAASKYTQLLRNGQQSVKCLLQFLMKNFTSNSYDDDTASPAQTACDNYIYQNPKLDPQYKNVLNFFIECRKLLALVRERNQIQIYKLVNQSRYVMLGSLVPQQHYDLLRMIIQLSGTGLDIYFKYIKTVITGIKIYFTRKNDNTQFIDFVNKMAENAKIIINEEPFDQSAKRQETNDFFTTVNSFLSKSYY